MRAVCLSLFFLVTACGGAAAPATPSSANAAVGPSGEWAVRWDRSSTGWTPKTFNGTLDVWRDEGAWRASLHFDESVAKYTFSSMTVDGDTVDIVFHAPATESGKAGDFEIRGALRDGRVAAEAQWGPIGWLPFKGYRTGDVPSAPKVDPTRIAGVVVNPDGTPAAGAEVVVVAGDRSDRARADSAGHFAVHSPATGEALLYAYVEGRSARQQRTFDDHASVTLKLVEPGTIEGSLAGPGASAGGSVWLTPGKVAAILPGIWGRQAPVSGGRFELDKVPAGDIEIQFAIKGESNVAGHALVHVDPGATATAVLDLKPATASVSGNVVSAKTHQALAIEAFLLLPDGSPEAWYPVPGGHFGFGDRSAGDRVLLLVAPGYVPRRVPVTLVEGKADDVGDVVLEPVSAAK
jgi:hypothetical protein